MSWWSDLLARLSPSPGPPLEGPPASILVVEPSATIRKVFDLTFPVPRWTCLTVERGEEAVAQLATDRPDVLFAAADLSGSDGVSLCSEMKRRLGGELAAAFLLVGPFEMVDRERALASGVDGVVVKPFRSQEVVALAARAIDAKRASSKARAGS